MLCLPLLGLLIPSVLSSGLGGHNATTRRVEISDDLRRILPEEDIQFLENFPIPMDRPEDFKGDENHKQMPPWISASRKQDLQLSAFISGAAYCEKDQIMSWTCGRRCNQVHGMKVIGYLENDDTAMACYFGVIDARKELYAVFRGSHGIVNWMHNFYIAMSPRPWDKPCPGVMDEIMVHDGFALGYNTISDPFVAAALKWMAVYKDYHVIITGQSLGGALATMAAVDLMQNMVEKRSIELIAHGSPRVGNAAFAQMVKYYFPTNSTRVVNGNDVVPRVPPYMLGYRHISQEVFIPPLFSTHTQPGYLCDPQNGEDSRCMNAYQGYSLADHAALPNSWEAPRFGAPCEP